MVRALPVPRDLVLREANMQDLRECLQSGELDIILIPAVAAMPRFEHRVIDVEPIVVVTHTPGQDAPLELEDAGKDQFILVPDACGLTTFTTQLFRAHELPLRTYAGEAASYGVLQEWAKLGLGSAMVPRSKLTSPDLPHRTADEPGPGGPNLLRSGVERPLSARDRPRTPRRPAHRRPLIITTAYVDSIKILYGSPLPLPHPLSPLHSLPPLPPTPL